MPTDDAAPDPDSGFDAASYASTMVADRRTGPMLARATLRYTVVRPATILQVVAGVGLAAAAVPLLGSNGSPFTETFVAALMTIAILVALVRFVVRTLRSARRLAPPGTVLAFDTAPGRIRMRNALGEVTLPLTTLRRVRQIGDCTLLVTGSQSVIPLPTALVAGGLGGLGPSTPRSDPDGSAPVPDGATTEVSFQTTGRDVDAPALPYVLHGSDEVVSGLQRDATLRALREPSSIAIAVVALLLIALVVVTRSLPVVLLLVSAMLVLGYRAMGVLGNRMMVHARHGPGTLIAAGIIGDDLVVRRGDHVARVPMSGLTKVRREPIGLVLYTRTGGRQSLPAGLLPATEVERLKSAIGGDHPAA